jgi:hypothetical protein
MIVAVTHRPDMKLYGHKHEKLEHPRSLALIGFSGETSAMIEQTY